MMDLKQYFRDIPNFPIDGIIYKDMTSVLNNSDAFRYAIDQMSEFVNKHDCDVIVGPEAGGFLFSGTLAYKHNKRLVRIRKPNKLPRETLSIDYTLEYGKNTFELQKNDIKPGDKVLIVDDCLATGGTTKAIIQLVEQSGGIVVGLCFLSDLLLENKDKSLNNYDVYSVIQF